MKLSSLVIIAVMIGTCLARQRKGTVDEEEQSGATISLRKITCGVQSDDTSLFVAFLSSGSDQR